MKRFRFRLAGVQRLREHAERVAKRELGARTVHVQDLETRLEAVDRNLLDCRHTNVVGGGLGVALEGGLTALRARLVQEHKQAESDLELARAVYSEKHRDAETLRRLHEKRRQEWMTESAKIEQAELDEIARIRFVREGEKR